MLLWGKTSAGKEKGKQQKSNAARMEKQQRTETILAGSILSEQSGSEQIFFFLLAQSFDFPLKAEKSLKGNFVFNTWKQKSLEKK